MRTILLIGPNFHDFNQNIADAFQSLGYHVDVLAYDSPITPYSAINKIKYKLSHAKVKIQLRDKSAQVFSCNAKKKFDELQPQLVFLLNGEMLTADTVAYFQKSAKVVVWFFDSIIKLTRCWNILRHCDKVYCYEQRDIPLIKSLNIDSEFLPQAVSPKAYFSIPKVEKKWDIVFAADMWQSNKRKQLIQQVVQNFSNCKIRVWGIYKPWYKGLWKNITRERRDIYMNCNASTAQLNLDYNKAKIVLNIHNEQQAIGANPKVYEIAASGSYQICDANPYIESLFPNGEIGLYHNEEELMEQIRWALDPQNEKERETKAKQAQEIVLASHTFVDRMREVLQSIV